MTLGRTWHGPFAEEITSGLEKKRVRDCFKNLLLTFTLSSLSGIKKTQMRKNKEKKLYNFGKLFAPNSS